MIEMVPLVRGNHEYPCQRCGERDHIGATFWELPGGFHAMLCWMCSAIILAILNGWSAADHREGREP